MELRNNAPLYNEVPIKANGILHSRQTYSETDVWNNTPIQRTPV